MHSAAVSQAITVTITATAAAAPIIRIENRVPCPGYYGHFLYTDSFLLVLNLQAGVNDWTAL